MGQPGVYYYIGTCLIIYIQVPGRNAARWDLRSAETVLAKRKFEAWGSSAARNEARARLATQRNGHEVDTPPRILPVQPTAGKNKQKRHEKVRRVDEVSGSSWRSARWNDTVRENIIGRTSALVFRGRRCRNGLFAEDGAFALIHEPTSEHGGSVFLEILVEEGGQFLAEIGGVSEAGKLIGLESVTGSGEKELPGRLGVMGVQENLLEQVLWKRRGNGTTEIYVVTSNPEVTRLWKSVQAVENVWGACSGCAGDYEDPDRSAWEPDPEEDEEDTAGAEISSEGELDVRGDEKRPKGE